MPGGVTFRADPFRVGDIVGFLVVKLASEVVHPRWFRQVPPHLHADFFLLGHVFTFRGQLSVDSSFSFQVRKNELEFPEENRKPTET
jgi:hypothetical protein